MSKNLIKSYFLNRENNGTKIIDTNELVAKRLEMIQSVVGTPSKGTSGFEAVDLFENAPVADPLDVLSGEKKEEKAAETQDGDAVQEVNPGPGREEMIADAEKEIAAMKEEARAELEAEREKTLEAAKAEGYEAGKAEGMRECDSMKAELEEQKQKLLDAYESEIEQLEPKFVSVLTDIYEQVINYDIQNKKPLVVGMLRNAMRRLDGCKNYLVHVSGEDYLYVKNHKGDLLQETTGENIVIDIVEDHTMKETECTIETANGIYDCGLGTQLNELKKKLRLLSYEP